MTRKLYLEDPHTLEFPAVVRATGTAGGKPFAVLEETFFYAECGGQLADRGWLGGVPVVDVQDTADGLRHVLEKPLAASPGDRLEARVDASVRRDHTEQHTGQHVLSAGFLEVLGAPTMSFHMGVEAASTIDLDRADLTRDEVARVEDRVNAVIREDRPIAVLHPSEAELAAMSLRKEPQVTGGIRVIAVEGFDMSPCGGTHCTRTGQLGSILVRRWERVRQKVRVHFLVGGRALADHRAKSRIVLSIGAALSARDGELEARVSDVLARQKELARELAEVREELAGHEASAALAGARWLGRHRWVQMPAVSADHAKALVLRLAASPDVVALAGTPNGEVAIACGVETGVHAGQLFRELGAARQARGGGQPALAQGRVPPDQAAAFTEDVRAFLVKTAGDPAAHGRLTREHTTPRGDRVRIRETLPSDAGAICAYMKALLVGAPLITWEASEYTMTPEQQEARLTAIRGKPNAISLVAEAGGEIIGLTDFRAGERNRLRHAGELGISVADGWRGQRVGRALMEALIDFCRGIGVRKLKLGVLPQNEPARKLYASLGFVEEGRIGRWLKIDGEYVDEVEMGLWLGESPGS